MAHNARLSINVESIDDRKPTARSVPTATQRLVTVSSPECTISKLADADGFMTIHPSDAPAAEIGVASPLCDSSEASTEATDTEMAKTDQNLSTAACRRDDFHAWLVCATGFFNFALGTVTWLTLTRLKYFISYDTSGTLCLVWKK